MNAVIPPRLKGLSDIAADYDGLICDVWGVVHNGREAYGATSDALMHFRQERGPVILLTNAPRLASEVAAQLDRFGVPKKSYDAIMTSGEASRAELKRRITAKPDLAVYHLGPERDRGVYDGLGVRLVSIDEADLLLCTGLFDDENETPENYRETLAKAEARGFLFVCANPDIVVQRGDKLLYCAGALARAYEALQGEVLYFGKPHRPVFDAALAALNAIRPVRRVLMVGDGAETDIKGANTAGLDALFVTGGIHGAKLAGDTNALAAFLKETRIEAVGVMPNLTW